MLRAVHDSVAGTAASLGLSHRDVVTAATGIAIGVVGCSILSHLKSQKPAMEEAPPKFEKASTRATSVPQGGGAASTPASASSSTAVRSTASSGVTPGGGSSVYESNRAVDEYLHFHYALSREIVPFSCAPRDALNFAARCGLVCASNLPTGSPRLRALDIGCAVGGSTLELAKHFKEAVGIDFSHAFIAAANDLKEKGKREYTVNLEGEIQEQLTAYIPADVDTSRVTFLQGDACNLPESLGQFDAVLAANLLCRLPEPMAFLSRLSTLVKPGGIVVLISPYSWLEEYTPKSKWIGGFISRDGKPQESANGVRRALEADFDLVSQQDMPFLIREHRRKYQWGCSHCSVWRRRGSAK